MRDLSSLQSILAGLPVWGRRPAIGLRSTFATRWWSYARLHRNALHAAHIFAAWGLTAGDRIVLFAPNSPEWAACLLGAAWRGLVIAAVDAATALGDVERLARDHDAKVIVVIGRHSTAGVTHRTLRLLDLDPPPDLDLDAAALRVPVRPDDLAAILFTSGTGGEPRAVPLTHHNLACQLPRFQFWRPVLRLAPARLLALSPLSHIQGLLLSLCVPLTLGLSVVYSTSIEPHHLARTIRFGRIRVLSTVPRVLQLLEDSMKMHTGLSPRALRRRLLGRTFRGILTGGATLPLARELFWREAGVVLVQGYGSTESTGFVTINRPIVGRRGSIGRAVHPHSLRIAPDGELLVRGPHVSRAYASDAEKNSDAPEGFLPTGDLVRQDEGGRLYFLGRKSDRIVTAEGHNVDPNQIETALREHAALLDAVVFAREHAGLEELHAVLLLAEPSAHVAAQIVLETNRTLAPWQRMRGWTVWSEPDFPRAALGKAQRDAVIAAVLNAPAVESDTGRDLRPPLERILEQPDSHARIAGLAAYLRRATPEASASELRARARQFDLDSIEGAELSMLLEQTERRAPRLAEFTPTMPLPVDAPAAEMDSVYPRRSSAPVAAPAWQQSLAGSIVRAVCGPVFRHLLLPLCVRVQVTGRERLAALDAKAGPIFFAVHWPDREHPVEYLALIRALPGRLRSRALLLSGDRPMFETHFYRKPEDSALYRFYVSLAFNVLIPMVLPLVVLEGGTTRGLEETDAWIARGFHPLVTWSRSMARLAAETQATVVPVRLGGERRGWLTSRVEVRFEDPGRLSPFAGDVAAHIQIESATAAAIETELCATPAAARSERPAQAPMRPDAPHPAHTSAPASRPSIAGALVRSIAGPVFRRFVLPLGMRVEVTGAEKLARLDGRSGPIFFAVDRHERKHPVEILALVRALPMRLAQRVIIVMGVPLLEEKLRQDPAHATRYRLYVSAMIHVGIPAVFPLVIGGQGTIAGMEETDYWLARGFHPIVTWSRAIARLAAETQATVVPVRLGGHRPGWFHSRAEIHFAEPIRLYPFASDMAADIQVQTAFSAPTELVS